MHDADKPRLADLATRLAKARGRSNRRRDGPAEMNSATRQVGAAYRIFVELLAGILVGGALGWALDVALGTRPWLMLALLLVGLAAGVMNTIRTARRMAAEMMDKDERPTD
jgi:ATP synthase protein I